MEGNEPPIVMNADFYLLWLTLCWITYPPLYITYVFVSFGGIRLFLLVTVIGFSIIPGLLWPFQRRKLRNMNLEPTFNFKNTLRIVLALIALASFIFSLYLTEIWYYSVQ